MNAFEQLAYAAANLNSAMPVVYLACYDGNVHDPELDDLGDTLLEAADQFWSMDPERLQLWEIHPDGAAIDVTEKSRHAYMQDIIDSEIDPEKLPWLFRDDLDNAIAQFTDDSDGDHYAQERHGWEQA